MLLALQMTVCFVGLWNPVLGAQARQDAGTASLLAALEVREAMTEVVESTDRAWWVPAAGRGWLSMGVAQRGWSRDGRWYMFHHEDAERGGAENLYVAGGGQMVTLAVSSPKDSRQAQLNGLVKEASFTVRDGDKSVAVFLGLTVETVRDRTVAELFRSAKTIREWRDEHYPSCTGLECETEMYGHGRRLRVLLDPAFGMAIRYYEEFDSERGFPIQRLVATRFSMVDSMWIPTGGVFCSYTLTKAPPGENDRAMAEGRAAIQQSTMPGTTGESERKAALDLFESGPSTLDPELLWRPISKNLREPLVPQVWEASDLRLSGNFKALRGLVSPHLSRTLMSSWTFQHTAASDALATMGFDFTPQDEHK